MGMDTDGHFQEPNTTASEPSPADTYVLGRVKPEETREKRVERRAFNRKINHILQDGGLNEPEPKYRTVPCPDGIEGCLAVHQEKVPEPVENPRLLTDEEWLKCFEDDDSRVCRESILKAQDAKSFKAGKKAPTVEEIADEISSFVGWRNSAEDALALAAAILVLYGKE